MSDIAKTEYSETDERMLIGISKKEKGVVETPELWKIYFEDGCSERLGELEEISTGTLS